MQLPKKIPAISDPESGEIYFDSLLSGITLMLLVVTVGLRGSNSDFFLSSFLGSVCGLAGMIFSIMGIISGIRTSRTQRTVIGIGALITNAIFTFGNAQIFLVDALHLFS